MRIEKITDLEPWMGVITEVNNDPAFSCPAIASPDLLDNNLLQAVNRPDRDVLGIRQDGAPAGLFVLIVDRAGQYLEMNAGLCRSADGYEALAAYIQEQYPGYHADFVFNPANRPLKELLVRKRAAFQTEQMKMVYSGVSPSVRTDGIELLSGPYREQYFAMHSRDVYWTGEKAAEQDWFRILIAVEDRRVVGYIDVTSDLDENEPYDLLVLEDSRRKGWGRKLLARALEMNRPRGMMLLVEVDNIPAIRLYESMGFERVPGQNSLTAAWEIPSA